MPIDDQTISNAINEILVKERALESSRGKLRLIRNNLESIQKTQIKKINENGGYDTIEEEPKDRELGGKLNAKRKQKIYDKALADITALE